MRAEMRPAGAATPTGADNIGKNNTSDPVPTPPEAQDRNLNHTSLDVEMLELAPPSVAPLSPAGAPDLVEQTKISGEQDCTPVTRFYVGRARIALVCRNVGMVYEEQLGIDTRFGCRHVTSGRTREALSPKLNFAVEQVSDEAVAGCKGGKVLNDPGSNSVIYCIADVRRILSVCHATS